MSNITVVTGAGSLVSAHIIKRLLELGFLVRGTVRNVKGFQIQNLFSFVFFDLFSIFAFVFHICYCTISDCFFLVSCCCCVVCLIL